MKVNKIIAPATRAGAALAALMLLWPQLTTGPRADASAQKRPTAATIERARPEAWGRPGVVEQAAAVVCAERAHDPQGSIPIDGMAAQPPLPLNDPRVKEGRKRAERLLPVAKKLVPPALAWLAAAYNLESLDRKWIAERVNAVRIIKVEVEGRDNARWRPGEPNAITFGTVFLAGLRSDEAMLAVLSHELTHAIDGTDDALQPLVGRIGLRAAQAGRGPVVEAVATELTCELIGLSVMREYPARKSTAKSAGQRLTRALGKDCVETDIADENHLSPRDTMRVLLALEPELTRAIIEASSESMPRSRTDKVRADKKSSNYPPARLKVGGP